MKTNSVPKIRFKGFTDDWEQRELGEIAARVQGNDGRMDLPTLTISAANGWMNQKERFSGNIAGKEQKNYTLLHKGELSYNHGNSKLAKYGAVFSLETYKEALVPRVYHSFKVIDGNPKFIEYYFATKIPDRELAKLVSSGARMDGLLNINFNEFMGINLTVPNKSEQEKISNYFSNLDHLITLHQRKCEQTKELKKFMLQKMFPKKGEKNPEIRFPGFTDDWEQRKLGDVFDERSERASGNEELLSVTISNGVIRQIDSEKRNIASEDKSNYKVVKKGDVPYNSMRMWQGAVGTSDYDGIVSPAYTVLIPKNNCNGKFFMELFKKQPTLENFKRWSQGLTSDTWNLKYPVLSTIPFMVPSVKEQEKIAEYFKSLDHLITLHQRKCEQLKELKKFMLQNMFPKKG
ncbi:restriction endonuclease subunit S [uncultured Streptococcus sp.]|uniref:restriction endonuclease subunit S n=1 Tax=uncultured Streptococcus sp. TaxID=83427 RepID=UPI00259AE550|nr:restriction endonuclease subunit S [uncultured Streptococcus sp.]